MINAELYQGCIDLMKREMIPALGCTEPVAIALACAKAASLLPPGDSPQRVKAYISRNIVKNAMGVTIPGTGLCGAEYACALGIAGGNAERGLEVLAGCTQQHYDRAKQLIDDKCVEIKLASSNEPIYIDAYVQGMAHTARAVICGMHEHFIKLERDDEVLLNVSAESALPQKQEASTASLTLKNIWDFVNMARLEDLALVYQAVELNMAISRDGLEHPYGLLTGKLLYDELAAYPDSATPERRAIMQTLAAVDARMAGSSLSVMSNSGSGNQGITATVPVCSVAQDLSVDESDMIRAVAFSHLVAIYIKEHLDRLSSLCGAIVAAVGAGCAIARLQGGDFETVERTLINILASVTGMICDGAKPSCSLKVSTALSTAFQAVMLALKGIRVTSSEGIVAENAEETIDILGQLTKKGMRETDLVILDIMLHKNASR